MSFARSSSIAVLVAVVAAYASKLLADPEPDASVGNVTMGKDGTVNLPAFSVPLSRYMSEQSKARFIEEMEHGWAEASSAINEDDPDYRAKVRRLADDLIRPQVEHAKRLYPVRIEKKVVGGVTAYLVTPEGGVLPRNRDRILINLHGGGFVVGAGDLHGLAESIPVAGIGGFKVLTVDYRLAPEHRFPAATEDVVAVYKELLKRHDAKEIGMYGCSAGGILSAMAVSWFQKHNLPAPGAIGLMGSAAFGNFYSPDRMGSWSGDSAYVALPLTGNKPRSLDDDHRIPPDAYLRDADLSDPLVSPALWPEVLAKFPPTLLITGTRSWDFSAAIQTHRELTKSGAEADLHLWDGMGHCFFLDADLPESREAHDVLVKFFDRHLSTK